MAFSFKKFMCITVLAGSIAQSMQGSSLPALAGVMVGDILATIGSFALFTNGQKTAISHEMPPSIQNAFDLPYYAPFLLIPGIVLSFGCRLYMNRKAEGFGNKLRAILAQINSGAGVTLAAVGLLILKVHASQTDQNNLMQKADTDWYTTHEKNNPFNQDMLDKIRFMGNSFTIAGALLASISMYVAP